MRPPGSPYRFTVRTGIFEIALEAADREAALGRIWDAVAAAGADDHIAFAEHSDRPEHWRDRDAG
jgi:hypothetical protein